MEVSNTNQNDFIDSSEHRPQEPSEEGQVPLLSNLTPFRDALLKTSLPVFIQNPDSVVTMDRSNITIRKPPARKKKGRDGALSCGLAPS